MYKVKPFESFNLSDITLPNTMYKMNPIYGTSFKTNTVNQTGGDQTTQSLNQQTERLNNLNLSDSNESINIVLQLPITSSLLDYLIALKKDQNNNLNVRIYRHCSLLNEQIDNELIKKWDSLAIGPRVHYGTKIESNYRLEIILKSNEFTQSCLFKSDSNLKLLGEIKILALLNGLIQSSMSVQVNDLNDLVHKLLLDEYLGFLQDSINTKQVDQNRLTYYRSNLQIKTKVLEIAELIYKNQFKN